MGVHTFAGLTLTILGLRELHTSKCGRAKHFYQENDKSFFLTIHVSNWQITGFLQSTTYSIPPCILDYLEVRSWLRHGAFAFQH